MTVDHNGRLERYADSAAGASEGQAPVAFAVPQEMAGASFIACAIRGGAYTVPLYLNPSAEIAALRERIAGMEKDAIDAGRFRMLYKHGVPAVGLPIEAIDLLIAKEKQG